MKTANHFSTPLKQERRKRRGEKEKSCRETDRSVTKTPPLFSLNPAAFACNFPTGPWLYQGSNLAAVNFSDWVVNLVVQRGYLFLEISTTESSKVVVGGGASVAIGHLPMASWVDQYSLVHSSFIHTWENTDIAKCCAFPTSSESAVNEWATCESHFIRSYRFNSFPKKINWNVALLTAVWSSR